MKPKRYLKGMKKCGFHCTACPYINETKNIFKHMEMEHNKRCRLCNIKLCLHDYKKNILGKQIANCEREYLSTEDTFI